MGGRRSEGGGTPGPPRGRAEPGGGRHLTTRPRPPARLRAALFDLDGTLTRPRSSWQEIHESLGIWSGQAERYQDLFRAGRISYEEFCRRDAEAWRGIPIGRLREICDAIPYHEGVRDLVGRLRAAGWTIGIVSTGLALLADRVAGELRLDHAVANDLEVEDGLVTGGVKIVLAHGEKDRALREFCARFGLDPSEVAAVGDTEGDLSMFRAAGWSVAFNAADASVVAGASAAAEGNDLRALGPCLLPGD